MPKKLKDHVVKQPVKKSARKKFTYEELYSMKYERFHSFKQLDLLKTIYNQRGDSFDSYLKRKKIDFKIEVPCYDFKIRVYYKGKLVLDAGETIYYPGEWESLIPILDKLNKAEIKRETNARDRAKALELAKYLGISEDRVA